jgi:DNA-binding NarL/FixJ family response regulator
MLRLGIVDDHQLFREGLCAIIAGQPDLTVVGEAADAPTAFAMVEAAHPDVLVLDLTLPGVNGISVAREVHRRDPRNRVLILSAHADDDFVSQAFAAGARGYSLKSQPSVQVIEAIRAVGRGETYLSSSISRSVVEGNLQLRRGAGAGAGGPCDALSVREQEVFDLLVRGFNNDAIAAHLCISVKTVETHRAHILKKLGVHSLVDLVRFAARHQLLRE